MVISSKIKSDYIFFGYANIAYEKIKHWNDSLTLVYNIGLLIRMSSEILLSRLYDGKYINVGYIFLQNIRHGQQSIHMCQRTMIY